MSDYETPKEKEPVDYTGVKIGLVLLPVFFLITFLYNADAGLAAYIVVGVMVCAIKIRWYLRKHIWFWAIIAVILALHVPLVFMAQWPKNAPTIFYAMPIGIADFLTISGALKLAESFMSKASSSNDETNG